MNKKDIVLASNNPGKVREINELTANSHFHVIAQSEFGVVEAEETGLTFIENALLKARNAALHTNLPVIADDSGIEVPALLGKPGIYSARYAGINATDEENLNKLIEEIRPLSDEQRQARFVCVMVFLEHANDPTPIISQGIWEGQVITEPQGKNGFGYDPMFYVKEYECTSADLAPDVKNLISHRGQALRELINKISAIKNMLN